MSDSVINGESKQEFLKRIHREGRLKTFDSRRKQMTRNGVPAKESWRILRESPEFQPIGTRKVFEDQPGTVLFDGDGSVAGNESDGIEARLPSSKVTFDHLMVEKKKNGKFVSMMEVVRWVFENLDNPSPGWEEAPSLGAYALLGWAKSGASARTEFYKSFAVKLMPTKTEMDGKMSFSDDGRQIFHCLDQFEDALDEEDD